MLITRDWHEVTEDWQQLANWVFLDLVEELKRKGERVGSIGKREKDKIDNLQWLMVTIAN